MNRGRPYSEVHAERLEAYRAKAARSATEAEARRAKLEEVKAYPCGHSRTTRQPETCSYCRERLRKNAGMMRWRDQRQPRRKFERRRLLHASIRSTLGELGV